eukprot:3435236-Rhodomonas_salina.2
MPGRRRSGSDMERSARSSAIVSGRSSMANVRDRHWTVGVGRARGCYRAADHAGREVLAEGSDILFRELVLGLLLVRGQPRVCSPSVRCVRQKHVWRAEMRCVGCAQPSPQHA